MQFWETVHAARGSEQVSEHGPQQHQSTVHTSQLASTQPTLGILPASKELTIPNLPALGGGSLGLLPSISLCTEAKAVFSAKQTRAAFQAGPVNH